MRRFQRELLYVTGNGGGGGGPQQSRNSNNNNKFRPSASVSSDSEVTTASRTDHEEWTFSSSFLFALSLITTVGEFIEILCKHKNVPILTDGVFVPSLFRFTLTTHIAYSTANIYLHIPFTHCFGMPNKNLLFVFASRLQTTFARFVGGEVGRRRLRHDRGTHLAHVPVHGGLVDGLGVQEGAVRVLAELGLQEEEIFGWKWRSSGWRRREHRLFPEGSKGSRRRLK